MNAAKPHVCVGLYNWPNIFTDIPHTVLSTILRKQDKDSSFCINKLKKSHREGRWLFSRSPNFLPEPGWDGLTPHPVLFCDIESACSRGDGMSPETFKIFSILGFLKGIFGILFRFQGREFWCWKNLESLGLNRRGSCLLSLKALY